MPDADGPLEPYEDGLHPPAIPTKVFCLHCLLWWRHGAAFPAKSYL
jgi:hypothetical protein